MYCQRIVTPDILKEFLSTGILVLSLTKNLILKTRLRKQFKDYSVLHQDPAREIKSLDIILRHQRNLKAVLKKDKWNELGKQQKEARAKVRPIERAKDESVAPEQQGFNSSCS